MTDNVHPFESAGLGLAPFRYVAFRRQVGPIHLEDGTTIGAPGQPMGTCDYCGQGIANCCVIASSDGKHFIVGLDCVEKTDYNSWLKAREEYREFTRTRRRVRRHVKQIQLKAEREARFREMLESNELGFVSTNDLWQSLTSFRKARQQALSLRLERQRAISQHVGKIGQRMELTVTLEKLVSFQAPSFRRWGATETRWLSIMRDDKGNAVTWWNRWPGAKEGETVRIKGTVKEHAIYKGGKQTVLNRVAVLEG